MRLRIKSGYGGWEKNQTSAASEESTWGETRETGVGEDKEEATHVATKSECRHAEFINIFNKNLGISYTLLTNSGTPPSLYTSLPLSLPSLNPTPLTSHAHCLPPRFPGQWKRCWYSGITDALHSADFVGDFHVFFTQKHILFPYQWLLNWWPWIDCWHTQLWHQASSHTSFSSANRSSPKHIHRQVGLAQSKWTQRPWFGYCHVQELLLFTTLPRTTARPINQPTGAGVLGTNSRRVNLSVTSMR